MASDGQASILHGSAAVIDMQDETQNCEILSVKVEKHYMNLIHSPSNITYMLDQ